MKACKQCYVYKEEVDFIYPSSKNTFSVCKKCKSKGNIYKGLDSSVFTHIKLCKKCNKFFPRTTEFFFKKLKAIANDCKDCSLKVTHSYYVENNKEILRQKQAYYKDNIERITDYKREYSRSDMASEYYKVLYQRRRNNPLEYLKKNVSSRILNFFKSKGLRKNKLTIDILGCSREEFYKHLIKTFECNYKIQWKEEYIEIVEVDHILPISLAMNENEIYELNHYSNLQFLFWNDNTLKSNNLDWKLDLTKTKLYDTINSQFNMDKK